MPNYRIIGADSLEYGPVSAEQIRQWITEGRVNAETKLRAEGTAEWKPLAEVPEFTVASPGTAASACPTCGEPFEKGFDSCWKCGTGKDGSRPKAWAAVVDDSTEPAEPCPKCGSSDVIMGELSASRYSLSATFLPTGARIFSLALTPGVALSTDPSYACRDCGLVWNYLRPDELKEFISKHCTRSDQQDAYALLAEGVRLESKGNAAGALTKYEAVIEKFPGTEAAKDAEISIRHLRDASG